MIFFLQSFGLFFKIFKKAVQQRKEELYFKEGIRSQITLTINGACDASGGSGCYPVTKPKFPHKNIF